MIRLIFILLITFSATSFTNASNIYVSSDQFGNRVYSDTPPQISAFEIIDTPDLATVKWQANESNVFRPTTKKPRNSVSQKSNSQRTENIDSKSQRCIKLKNAIHNNEDRLNTRLKAEDFSKVKLQLSEDRRRYRKSCV